MQCLPYDGDDTPMMRENPAPLMIAAMRDVLRGALAPARRVVAVLAAFVIAFSISVANAQENTGGDTTPPESSSVLAEDALAAVFGLLSRQGKGAASKPGDERGNPYPRKQRGGFRIALLLPQKGVAAEAARDIHAGAELALFVLARPEMDMVLIDTAADAKTVAKALKDSKPDIVLGPLFAATTGEVIKAARLKVPVISFSNDIGIAGDGVYVFGQTPEAEIRVALGHALEKTRARIADEAAEEAAAVFEEEAIEEAAIEEAATGQNRRPVVAIIAGTSDYAERIAGEAENLLAENLRQGQDIRVRKIVLDKAVLADQNALNEAIAGFILDPENADIAVLAGDVSFTLRVAPVLAWHDISSDEVLFVGTSLWASPAILQEPSLRGGIFASVPGRLERNFAKFWKKEGLRPPGRYAALGYDAVALASLLAQQKKRDFDTMLTRPTGFSGFSGVFRFNPGGDNVRLLDVLEIGFSESRLIAAAPRGF